MTVCIAAYSSPDKQFVSVSDHMLTMAGGDFVAERAALKDNWLSADWSVMFAGDDVGVVPSLVRRIRAEIGAWNDVVSADAMAQTLTTCFQAERLQRASELYLFPNNLTIEDLTARRSRIDPTIAGFLRERVENHKLGCELLVFGFDGDLAREGAAREGHILHVFDPGTVREYDNPGYWAIGSGAYLALSTLARRQHAFIHHIGATIFDACEAKFVAEAASGVGPATFVGITNHQRQARVFLDDDLKSLKSCWEEETKRPRPQRALEEIEAWVVNADWESRAFTEPDASTD